MSMTEYYIEQQIFFDEAPDDITPDSVWTTREGRRVAVKDMTDSHVLNLIRCFRGASPLGTKLTLDREGRLRWVNALANEAYSRGLNVDEVVEGEPVHE